MKNLLLAALIGFGAMGCKDRTTEDAQTLPPATTSGANTAGCYINGVLHLPKNGSQAIGGGPLYGLDLHSISNNYYIDIRNYQTSTKLYIYIQSLNSPGTFVIDQSGGIATPNGNSNTQVYLEYGGKTYLSGDNSGTVNVTNFTYPYFSGTFTATLYNENNPSDKISITEGRFDINRQTLNK